MTHLSKPNLGRGPVNESFIQEQQAAVRFGDGFGFLLVNLAACLSDHRHSKSMTMFVRDGAIVFCYNALLWRA